MAPVAKVVILNENTTTDPFLDGLVVGTPNEGTLVTYTSTESATPLAPGDMAAGTSTITVSGPAGPRALLAMDKRLQLSSGDQGMLLGIVKSADLNIESKTVTLTAESIMARLNRDVVAAPQVDATAPTGAGGHTSLAAALSYYCSLVGIGVVFDTRIAWRPFLAPGFVGNLWEHLKALCAAEGIELRAYLNGLYAFLPGENDLYLKTPWAHTQTSLSEQRAMAITLPYQNLRPVTSDAYLWKSPEVYSDLAVGERRVIKATFDGSPLSVQQPICTDYPTGLNPAVTPFSQYTVWGADGYNVASAFWNQYGGSITVEIDPEVSNGLIITIQAPWPPGGSASSRAPFKISDGMGDRPALWIAGTGVTYTPNVLTVPTGDAQADEELVEIPENIFVGNARRARDRGLFAAQQHCGARERVNISGTAELSLYRRARTDFSYANVNLLRNETASVGRWNSTPTGWSTPITNSKMEVLTTGIAFTHWDSLLTGVEYMIGRDPQAYNNSDVAWAVDPKMWNSPVTAGTTYTFAFRLTRRTGSMTLRPRITWSTGAISYGSAISVTNGVSTTGSVAAAAPVGATSAYVSFEVVTGGVPDYLLQNVALVQAASYAIPVDFPVVVELEIVEWYGNLAGAILTYRGSQWRVIDVSYSEAGVALVLERYVTIAEFDKVTGTKTIAQFDTLWSGVSIKQFDTMPLSAKGSAL